MCVTTSAITSARRLVMDISYPVFYVDQGIIIPFPRKGSKWMGTAVFKTYVRFFFLIHLLFKSYHCIDIRRGLRSSLLIF